ncbi:MAG: bifunctional riboflavin kinase/FAD synthetase [Oceanicoccus sp.]|uniref:bifunctional riboflavin kinase/FAD synthetase n=1 Tax=Oceanicoccus sp. TaxID=2691044 RepID=UPI0026087879|nr:bifunctional riboflavin kinase/FAD synthetase [Oceanicoccus sp.]MCP3908012.1 bifunctional riboflavin kinase/FAD synthetase [Oceanicoccus sp.]MDG1773486.1 bifunctional riboflavin kinase/FAD synthetase [Oceanicoccus sp.]
MELIRGLHNMRPRHRGCITTIGAFDGVHHGHQAILQQLIDKGKELNLPTTVVVFEPLPREYFAPLQAPARLMSFSEKFQALKALGIDRVLRIRFTPDLKDMGAKEFIQQVFVKGLGARYIIAGDDLRFGRNRGGDFDLLKSEGLIHGFDVVATSTLKIRDDRVSSTRIRKALEDSDFELAELLLGKPYSIAGRVIVGQQLGRQLGAPTANIALRRLRAPMSGVYAVEVEIGQRSLKGVANVGSRPTVDNSLKAILEVHILNFNEDIYGKKIKVIFRKKIRDEQKFDSIDQLKEQIYRDIQTGRQYLSQHISASAKP